MLFERARAYGTRRARRRSAHFVAGITMPVFDMVKLHPCNIRLSTRSPAACAARSTITCSIIGGSPSNRRPTNCARGSPPTPTIRRKDAHWSWPFADRRRRREQDLGPEFETTFDEKQADFAMALGTFYCEYLKAPILVDVEREGVVFARVYDLRGGPTPNLLTQPPP